MGHMVTRCNKRNGQTMQMQSQKRILNRCITFVFVRVALFSRAFWPSELLRRHNADSRADLTSARPAARRARSTYSMDLTSTNPRQVALLTLVSCASHTVFYSTQTNLYNKGEHDRFGPCTGRAIHAGDHLAGRSPCCRGATCLLTPVVHDSMTTTDDLLNLCSRQRALGS